MGRLSGWLRALDSRRSVVLVVVERQAPTLAQAPTSREHARGGLRRDPPRSSFTLAREGVIGAGERLPHFDAVQRSFGEFDLGHVRAFTGERASRAARSLGADAYALGDRVAFASSQPSLYEVAHEAAHTVQQQAGVQLLGGVGEVGDHYEQQADAVARATVEGRSAEPLLRGPSIRPSGRHEALQCIKTEKRKVGAAADAPEETSYVAQLKRERTTLAPGQGFIRAVSKKSAWGADDHAWILLEYVKSNPIAPVSLVTDLRNTGVKFSYDTAYLSSLMGAKYRGTTYPITEANAEAAIAKAESVSAGYQFDEVKGTTADGIPSTTSVPRADNKYKYAVTGKSTFSTDHYINCSRYAAKILKAAGVGSGWFEIRPRGGWLFKTPGQVASGLFNQNANEDG